MAPLCKFRRLDTCLSSLRMVSTLSDLIDNQVEGSKISFFNFCHSDEQVFTRFKPSKAIIRRLNLEKVIESSNIKESD